MVSSMESVLSRKFKVIDLVIFGQRQDPRIPKLSVSLLDRFFIAAG